ncbi:MAG: hypothetical protein ACQUYJ_07160 [Ferruginibacter sp.]
MKTKLIAMVVLLFVFYWGASQNPSGIYNTDFKEMTISQNANKVTGIYKHQNGRIEGTLNGQTLTGFWYQDNGSGRLIFEFNADFTAFTGKWGYNQATPTGKWNGTKIVSQNSSQTPKPDQQVSQLPVPKVTTGKSAEIFSNSKDDIKNTKPVAKEVQLKNKPLVKQNANATELNGTTADANRKPLNEYEKSLVNAAKKDLVKAITDEAIADSERKKMVEKSARTLKEYGQPAALPVGDIPLKTNREKLYKRIQEEVVSANNLRKLLAEALLAQKMSLINSMQIEILEEQIKILIPGKPAFELSKDLVGTIFGVNITEGFNGGQRQNANDLVQKFRDLATSKEIDADVEKLYLRQQALMKKAFEDIGKAEKLQQQLKKNYQDAENAAFTFKEFGQVKNSTVTNAAPYEGEGKGLWVLVETINYDGKTDLDNTNKNGVYQVSGSSSPGTYNYTWKYLGKADSYYNPPLLNGENSSIQCTISKPPKVMDAGETISLTISMQFTAQYLSYFDANASAAADFDKWDTKPGFATSGSISFVNNAGKSSFKINTHKSVKVFSVHENVTAIAPAGVKDMRIAIRTIFNPGARMGSCYIYQWKYAY